jgi:hypothetical protein
MTMTTKISSLLTISRSLRVWVAALAAIAMVALAAGTARADFGIQPDPANPALPDFHADALQSDGVTPYTQAGGHPFELVTSFNFTSTDGINPDGHVKDIVVDLPAGFVGNPTVVPTCKYTDLRNNANCPIQSQIGVLALNVDSGFGFDSPAVTPVFNMVPSPGDVATFGFNISNVLTSIHIGIRSDGDYGVRATLHNVSSFLWVMGSTLTLWGEPADPSHDTLRGSCLNPDGSSNGSCPANMPPQPFLSMPTDCSAPPQTTSIAIDSWESPATVLTYTSVPAPMVDGCDKLSFAPSISFQPASPQAGAPSGYAFKLHVPQNLTAAGVSTPDLKDAAVTLPAGVSISPSSVNGLGACTDDQFGVRVLGVAQCPDSSKIGTVRVDTPNLPDPATGHIFLGQPLPGQLFRLFVEAEGDNFRLKLVGNVSPNPITGQITTTFDDNPELPFSDFTLSFDGGPHAALSSPRACGTYTTTSSMTPYSAPTTPLAMPSDTFQITQGLGGGACGAAAFSPGFSAGTVTPVAGKSSDFTTTFTRGDGDQFLQGISLDMPAGLIAKIASVPVLCADAQAAAGTCDAGSKIGDVTTAAGPGTDPFYLPGQAYITGPYEGAPFGLSIVVPAKAGPFDLGTVVVRAAIFIDRQTTKIRIVSDPLPTILQGVPLQVRLVNVHVDRPGFMVNPTSCAPTTIGGDISSTDGASAHVSSRFQVGDCAALPFDPQMAITIGSPRHTRAGVSTPLTTTLRMPPGDANLRSVSVSLPTTLNALLPVLNRACTLADFQAGRCSSSARVGSAVAVTPLLRDPLRGSVFFVKNPARTLPDLMVALRGQVAVDLTGKVSVGRGNRLTTRFDTIPDVAVTKFALRLVSGANGPVGTTTSLCSAKARRALVQIGFRAQSGKLIQRSQRMRIAGCGKAAG